jgi:hypothetical protein
LANFAQGVLEAVRKFNTGFPIFLFFSIFISKFSKLHLPTFTPVCICVFLQIILQLNKISFSASKTLSRPILKIPEDKIVPYNAQATLHFYDAFWALFLPVTVAGKTCLAREKHLE